MMMVTTLVLVGSRSQRPKMRADEQKTTEPGLAEAVGVAAAV